MPCVHAEVKLKTLNTFSCDLYFPQRLGLFQNHGKNYSSFLDLNVKDKFSFLLYGSQTVTSKIFNHDILKTVISYTKDTGRFVE